MDRINLKYKLVGKTIKNSVEWLKKNDPKSYNWLIDDYLIQVLKRDPNDASTIKISFMKSVINLIFLNAGDIFKIVNSDWEQWENERLLFYYDELQKKNSR